MAKAKSGSSKFDDQLDWSRVTGGNGVPFQRMAQDLLFSDLGEDGFTPSPDHLGPDGGWDGMYNGKLLAVRGRWKIACAVRQSFGKLRAKAEEENQLAKRDGADGLLLLTPLDLRNPDCIDIEKVLAAGLKKARLWPRSMLRLLLERNPWVAAKHFGTRYVAGFVPVEQAQFADPLQFVDLPLSGRAELLSEIEQFVDGDEPVLLLVGPGGAGKSRLIREVPSMAKRRKPGQRPTIWLRRAGSGTIEEGLQPVLRKKRPALLCLDDAGYSLDEAAELVRLAQSCPDLDLKVVLACRIADQSLLESTCRENQVIFRVLAVPNLASEAAVAIVRAEFPDVRDEDARRLTRYYGKNLYLLRAAAAALKDGTSPTALVSDGDLRAMLSTRLVKETAQLLGKPEPEAERIVLECALDTPISPAVAERDSDVRALVEGGVLKRIGTGLRFQHDVEGDLLLAHFGSQPRGKAIISTLVHARRERVLEVLRNLAAAGEGHAAQIIESELRHWATNAADLSISQRRRRMQTLARCARSTPTEAVEVCRAFLTVPPAPPSDEIERLFAPSPLTYDEYTPVIIAIAQAGAIREALRLTLAVAEQKVPGSIRYGDRRDKQLTIAAEVVHPVHHSPQQISEALDEVEAWLSDGHSAEHKAPIIMSVVRTLLSRRVSWQSYDGTTMSMHEQSFEPTPAVVEVRGRALNLLCKALNHPTAAMRAEAADVASRFDWDIGRVGTSSMDQQVAKEIDSLLPVLAHRLHIEPEVEIADQIASGLENRWASRRTGAEEAARALASWSRPTLASAYEYVSRPSEWVTSYAELIESAPSDERRWEWWVDRSVNGWDSPEKRNRLIAQLEELCTTTPFESIVEKLAPGRAVSFLVDAWCEINPTRFEQARSSENAAVRILADQCVERFKLRHDARRILTDIRPFLHANDAAAAERMINNAPLAPELRLELARMLVDHPDVKIRQLGLGLVGFGNVLAVDAVASLLADAVRDGDWRGGWRAIWAILHRGETRELVMRDPVLVQTLLTRAGESLHAQPDTTIEIDDWHFNESIGILTDRVPEQRVALIGAVIDEEHVSEVAELAKPLLTDDETIRLFAESCFRWIRDGKLRSAAAISNLCCRALERASFAPGALGMALRHASDQDQMRRMVGLGILSELRSSPEASAEIAEVASDANDPLRADAENMLSNFTTPRNGWSYAPGEPPPAFVQLRDALGKALRLCRTEAAKAKIERLRRRIAHRIESSLRQDEEWMNAR